MNEEMPYSVHIFFPTGNPEGPRLIEKSNWTGTGLAFPHSRLRFDEVRARSELERTGVYVLWDAHPLDAVPAVYIGESDALLQRLDGHAKEKDFWTHAAVFTSKDRGLNKAHVRHLEARLVALAQKAKRCDLKNRNSPQQPSLSDADRAEAELYLRDLLLCVPVLGLHFFDTPRQPTEEHLMLKGKGIKAHGYETAAGFVVLTGSGATRRETASLHAFLRDTRQKLLQQGVFEDTGAEYRLTQDYTFPSPSHAAGVLLGASVSGRTAWKDEKGRSLKDIQEAERERE